MCNPVNVTNLVDEQEVDIRFPAPGRAGTYNYVVYVRSDSYIEIDCKYDFSITVHERQEEPEPVYDTDEEVDEDGGFVTDSDAEISESSSSEEESE